MTTTIAVQLVLLILLLALSAFFSSSETSMFSLTRLQIEQMRRDRHPRVELIERMLSQPRRLIVTILIGNEFVNIAASVISASVVIELLGPERSWVNLFVMVPALLLFGEITPKTMAIGHNVAFAGVQCRVLDLFAGLIAPLRYTIRHIADFLTTLITGSDRSPASLVTEDLVRSIAREAVGEGTLDPEEARYIDHIFDFGDTVLRDIMTPRSQIFSLPSALPLHDIAAEIRRTAHTKVPVYTENSETIIGVLFARDMLDVDLAGASPEEERTKLFRRLHQPYFVPESKLAADLFRTLQRRRLSLAFTVDEYGGLTGMVTMEDLLECIFGSIPSRSEQRRQLAVAFSELPDGGFRVGGTLPLEEFNRRVGTHLASEHAETIGGLLLHEFAELPTEGETIVLSGVEFTVSGVRDRRIREVDARLLHGPGEPMAAEREPFPPPPKGDAE